MFFSFSKKNKKIKFVPHQSVNSGRLTCCAGYKEVIEDNGTTVCMSICEGDYCVKGHCTEPYKCICDDGYVGKRCNESNV